MSALLATGDRSHDHELRIRSLTAAEHRAFVSTRTEASFLQYPSWASVKDRWTSEMVGWHSDSGEPAGAALVLYRQFPGTRKYFAYLPEGPVADWADPDIDRWLRPLMAHLRKSGAFAVRIGSSPAVPPLGHRPPQSRHRPRPQGERRTRDGGGSARHGRRRTAPGPRLAPLRRRRGRGRRRTAPLRLPGAARRTDTRRTVVGTQPGVAPQCTQGREGRGADRHRRRGRTTGIPPPVADHRGARRLPARPLPRVLPAAVRRTQRRTPRPDEALSGRAPGRDPGRPHHDQHRPHGSGTRPAPPPTTAARSVPATRCSGR